MRLWDKVLDRVEARAQAGSWRVIRQYGLSRRGTCRAAVRGAECSRVSLTAFSTLGKAALLASTGVGTAASSFGTTEWNHAGTYRRVGSASWGRSGSERCTHSAGDVGS